MPVRPIGAAAADRRGGGLRSGPAAARDAPGPARPAPGVRLVAMRQRRGLAPGRRRAGARRGRAPGRPRWPRAGPSTVAGRCRDAADIPGGAEVVGFASWREGLVVRPGTRVRGLDDVAGRGCGWSTASPERRRARCSTGSASVSAWTQPNSPAMTAGPPATCRWRRPSSAVSRTRACRAAGRAGLRAGLHPAGRGTVRPGAAGQARRVPRGPGPAQGAHVAVAAGPARQPARLRRRPLRRARILISTA